MIANFGNTLPFYRSKVWQAFRQEGQNLQASGILAPNDKLMPFQLRGTSGTATAVSWALVNAADETAVFALSAAALQIRNVSGGGWFVSFLGNSAVSTVVDAGYYYIRVSVSGATYYSEVLQLVGESEEAMAGLNVANCSGNLQFDLVANDTYSATLVYELTEIEINNQWTALGALPQTVIIQEPDSPIRVRRTIRLNTGRELYCDGSIAWSNPLNPCADLAITVNTQTEIANTNELYRVRFVRSDDRPPVMHQTGFWQFIYLSGKPVFDRTVVRFAPDYSELADGTRVLTNGSIKNVVVFEFPELLDNQVSGIVFAAANADLVVVEGVVSGESFTLTEVEFASEKTGIQLNKGIISGVSQSWSLGCTDNYNLL